MFLLMFKIAIVLGIIVYFAIDVWIDTNNISAVFNTSVVLLTLFGVFGAVLVVFVLGWLNKQNAMYDSPETFDEAHSASLEKAAQDAQHSAAAHQEQTMEVEKTKQQSAYASAEHPSQASASDKPAKANEVQK